jgi:uncharacterized membrane protein YadS
LIAVVVALCGVAAVTAVIAYTETEGERIAKMVLVTDTEER